MIWQISHRSTICPRSSGIYIVSYYMKWATTPRTYSNKISTRLISALLQSGSNCYVGIHQRKFFIYFFVKCQGDILHACPALSTPLTYIVYIHITYPSTIRAASIKALSSSFSFWACRPLTYKAASYGFSFRKYTL